MWKSLKSLRSRPFRSATTMRAIPNRRRPSGRRQSPNWAKYRRWAKAMAVPGTNTITTATATAKRFAINPIAVPRPTIRNPPPKAIAASVLSIRTATPATSIARIRGETTERTAPFPILRPGLRGGPPGRFPWPPVPLPRRTPSPVPLRRSPRTIFLHWSPGTIPLRQTPGRGPLRRTSSPSRIRPLLPSGQSREYAGSKTVSIQAKLALPALRDHQLP